MSLIPYGLARPFLFGLDAEQAHDLTLGLLARTQHSPLACTYRQARVPDPVTVAGLRFPNRVGLAAGLDKNARCIDGLAGLGFGFVEVGTVTPKPQPGNAKPRMFRLPQADALINRLGFNNGGLDAFIVNVLRAHCRQPQVAEDDRIVLGLNIGKNASTPIEQATQDYLKGLDGVYPHADYITVNVSSPNTQNLRSLQSDAALDSLLAALMARRADLAAQDARQGRRVPLFVKIAPDLDAEQIALIAATLLRHQRIEQGHASLGVIATNTTLERQAVQGLPQAEEAGGLSGRPVFEKSNAVIRQLRAALGPSMPIIGVGGVMSAADAVAKREAGADVVQIYTGLIYRGPGLVRDAALALKTPH